MKFSRVVKKYKFPKDNIITSKRNVLDNYITLPQISIHGLRHTHATILLLKGENVKVIADRLGHNSVKITLDTYSHVLPSMQKQTADLLNQVFDVL